MRLVFTLLALGGSLQLMAGFAMVAATLQQSGSTSADAVGFTGIGLSAAIFVIANVFIWRAA
jgi:hypothetical protein